MIKENLIIKDDSDLILKFKDAEKNINFYCLGGIFHVLPTTKVIFMFQSAIIFAYIVSNFPCSLFLFIFFIILCLSTIYSFYTCYDYFLIPLLSLLLTVHIILLYLGLSVSTLTISNIYGKHVLNDYFFGFIINNFIVRKFLSNSSLFNFSQIIIYIFISGIYLWQFITTWNCMKFFKIVKYHPTYCAVSMPPAYLSQLSITTMNSKINSLTSISVIGNNTSENDTFYMYKSNFNGYKNEIDQLDKESEKFYKSLIDINLL